MLETDQSARRRYHRKNRRRYHGGCHRESYRGWIQTTQTTLFSGTQIPRRRWSSWQILKTIRTMHGHFHGCIILYRSYPSGNTRKWTSIQRCMRSNSFPWPTNKRHLGRYAEKNIRKISSRPKMVSKESKTINRLSSKQRIASFHSSIIINNNIIPWNRIKVWCISPPSPLPNHWLKRGQTIKLDSTRRISPSSIFNSSRIKINCQTLQIHTHSHLSRNYNGLYMHPVSKPCMYTKTTLGFSIIHGSNPLRRM